MANLLNIKLKNGIEPSILLRYGFAPKYDENTGQIKEYTKKILVSADNEEQYFTFELHQNASGVLSRIFHYKAWMSVFNWGNVCSSEIMNLLFDLIIDGVIEPVEKYISQM